MIIAERDSMLKKYHTDEIIGCIGEINLFILPKMTEGRSNGFGKK